MARNKTSRGGSNRAPKIAVLKSKCGRCVWIWIGSKGKGFWQLLHRQCLPKCKPSKPKFKGRRAFEVVVKQCWQLRARDQGECLSQAHECAYESRSVNGRWDWYLFTDDCPGCGNQCQCPPKTEITERPGPFAPTVVFHCRWLA